MYYSSRYVSPIGPLLLVSDEKNLAGLWMEGQKYFCGTLGQAPAEDKEIPILMQTREWLDRYFAGERPEISGISLAPEGSPFRQQVWRLLCEIPYGQVTTYGELAKKLAVPMKRKTMSAQAVGGAVGHNPISILIPCHRVVGTDGSLTGYAGGLVKKSALLELEGVELSQLYVPKKGTAL